MRIKGKARKLKPVEPNEAAGNGGMRAVIIEHHGFLKGLLVDSVEEGAGITCDKLKRLPGEATAAISRGCISERSGGVAMIDKSKTSALCALAGMAGPEDEKALAGGA